MNENVKLILKNGFVYRGQIINETEDYLELNDIKLGNIQIAKDQISVRIKNGGNKHA